MKKRIISIALMMLLIVSACVTASADSSYTVDASKDIAGTKYYDYTVVGANSGKTADVHCIEFGPDSGLVPLAFAANSGTVDLAADHIAAAKEAGYTVVGAINGSFFEMSTGNPCGTLISDGKLKFTHSTLTNESVGVFGYDGSFDIVQSTLQFKMSLSGKNVPAGIGLVNKKYSATGLATGDITGRFHYYDIDACDLADETVSGYEILCEKLDGTDLSVGKTLKGKVIEVKENSTYGATKVTENNKFVLFLRSDSAKFADRAKAVKVDDEVKITPNESDSLFAERTANAQSALSSCYWLVRDGEDLTDVLGTIIHSTDLARAWTAFGIKEDGTYVYWASSEVDSEGNNAVTLKDVADAMVEMGCVDVVRVDGGGSTSIYVEGEGSPITTTRAVCDMLLIVKKDDLKSSAPSAEEPEESKPEESKPEESQPEESKPEESEPEVSEPAISEPTDNTDEDNGKPSVVNLIVCIALAVVVITGVVIAIVKKRK